MTHHTAYDRCYPLYLSCVAILRFPGSFSPSRKERKRDLRADAARGTPGFLRGCRAVPSAPHLDGQGHSRLRQRHVPVGETETAMPKSRRPFHRNQMPRQ